MSRYTVTVAPAETRTRLLLTDGTDELMRAQLPPGRQLRHGRAAATLLEGLSLWLDTRLQVALSADAQDASYYLGLVDELGCASRSVFFDVALIEPPARRRGKKISGIGDFRDLRQLALLVDGARR
jgi:hypothetical protein